MICSMPLALGMAWARMIVHGGGESGRSLSIFKTAVLGLGSKRVVLQELPRPLNAVTESPFLARSTLIR